MIIKNDKERNALIEGGARLAKILRALRTKVAPGVTTEELDDLAEKLIRDNNDTPTLIGYTPYGAKRPYPAALCVSINNEVVHGIPNEPVEILKEGDIVGLDLVLTHLGVIVDSAITVAVGNVTEETKKLLKVTERSLVAGIAVAIPGNHTGDIGYAIQKEVEKSGFNVIRDLGGHGVGDNVHEEPFIPNFGHKGDGEILEEGMVLALEPISSVGKSAVKLGVDGYTFFTKDGSKSAHFEHTILLEKDKARIITI